MFLKTVLAITFAFIVGGLVNYGISTTQALNNAVALADLALVPDPRQVDILSPSLTLPCPPSQDIVNNAGIPMRPTTTPTETYTTEPPVTEATGSPVETPTEPHPTDAPTATAAYPTPTASPAPTETSCVPPPTAQPYPTQTPTATATATEDPNVQEPDAQSDTNA
jgi:hypothetical protein